MILIGVKTNIVSSVCNQVVEHIACRVVAKLSAKRILEITALSFATTRHAICSTI